MHILEVVEYDNNKNSGTFLMVMKIKSTIFIFFHQILQQKMNIFFKD